MASNGAPSSGLGSGLATAPLELLGTQPGLSVVDPGTILTRLWYFDGRLLRAAGFRLDQEYVRSMVRLSNQATGTGIVHGFDVGRAGGDRLRVEAGLALAPSGRIVYLPQQVRLPIAELIARSADATEPSAPPAAGPAGFGRCPPGTPGGPVLTLTAHPLYLLTVSGVEALCGEEEQFGRLCEGACSGESDRSTVVEGVRFRVRELTLALPVSSAVAFTDRHLRSRVAAALFEAERRQVPAMISGSGLRTPVWCAAATGIDGEEVPLAVFDRSGSVTGFVDAWAARRELMTATPRRYWAYRMAMRPWDVFLAQVLQFQCQLLDLGAGADDGAEPDPCAAERDTLAATDDVLSILVGGTQPALDPDALQRLTALRERIATVLGAAVPATVSGSLLVDGGLVEVPAAGYLPTSLQTDVEVQVRLLFGPGVDLRFCAVRPDFVPEALQEAQHMERISLTRGLDDPTDLEQVDVLVPGGEVVDGPGTAAAFVGIGRILPRLQGGLVDPVLGSALSLSTVVRETSAQGWSWALAGYGEAPRRQSVPGLLNALFSGLGFVVPTEGDGDGTPPEVFIQPDDEHDRSRRSAEVAQRLLREGRLAAVRRIRLVEQPPDGVDLPPDRALTPGEDRPVAVWLDARTGAALETLGIGASTDVQGRATIYSRAANNPVLVDARLIGTLRVIDVLTFGSRRTVRTVLDGALDVFDAADSSPDTTSVRDFRLDWTFGELPAGTRFLGVTATPTAGEPPAASAVFTEDRNPRRIRGELGIRDGRATFTTPGWRPPIGMVFLPRDHTPAASLELTADQAALRPGSPSRALAESVISIIGAELARPGGDPSFPAYATDRMLAGTAGAGAHRIRATTDWVMFHRRRVRRCADEAVPPPVRTRSYLLYHTTFGGSDGRRLSALGLTQVAAAVPGFDVVTALEFEEGGVALHTPLSALRASWLAGDRGEVLAQAVVSDLRNSDGETVALGRLATLRSGLADLIDVSQTQVRYLVDLPPEFHQPGIDGVIVTIGVTRTVRTCLTVYRLSKAEFARVRSRIDAVGDTEDIETIIQLSEATADRFVVGFGEDGDVLDQDALRAEWAGFSEAGDPAIGLPGGGGSDEFPTWFDRARRVADVVGFGTVSDSPFPAQAGQCGAVLLFPAGGVR